MLLLLVVEGGAEVVFYSFTLHLLEKYCVVNFNVLGFDVRFTFKYGELHQVGQGFLGLNLSKLVEECVGLRVRLLDKLVEISILLEEVVELHVVYAQNALFIDLSEEHG